MQATATPARTDEQRHAALLEANRIRTYRANLKKEVAAGRRQPAAILNRDPDCDTMKVVELLLVLPKVGRVKADRLMRRVGISHTKTIAGLSDRQRRELLALLPR